MMTSAIPRGVDLASMDEKPEREEDQERPPEDLPDEPGAESGSRSPAAEQMPAMPSRDDSPLGDTDQHSEG
jgi:hypothetical protein